MQDRHSAVKDIVLGTGLAVVISGAIVFAQQIGTGPAKSPRKDPIDRCCAVVSIDAKAGTVTARITATGKAFTITDLSASELTAFKVGATFDMACGVPPSGGTGVTGNAAGGATGTSSGGGSGCGSNVGRNADTRPKDCVATNSAGQQFKVACPPGVPIKQGK
jgi:hypothetical protein